MIVLTILGGGMLAYLAFIILRWAFSALVHAIIVSHRPSEDRMREWLNDRQAARTLGVDFDFYMARKKIDGATQPVNVPKP